MKLAKHVSVRSTPQTEAIPGTNQAANNAGGFSFVLDDWKRLDRFLILGSEGGTYYVGEKKLTQDNAACVLRCAGLDAARTIGRIVGVSHEGKAPKNDPAIFALAMCASQKGNRTLQALACEAIPKVCRIGTHILHFCAAIQEMKGWSKPLMRAVSKWYEDRNPDQFAHQVAKYQSRDGWAHRDVFRLVHPRFKTDGHHTVARWVVCGGDSEALAARKVTRKKGGEASYGSVGMPPGILVAFETIKKVTDAKDAAKLIVKYDLPRECVPTQFLKSPEVWEALLVNKMPITAMIRNLGNMTAAGVIAPLSHGARKVAAEVVDIEKLKKGRIHPLALLVALKVYSQGHGVKGSQTWTPVQSVVDALNEAFYLAFDAIEPTGKRWMFGLDVSGSMSRPIAGTPISCAEATAALAMVSVRTEPYTYLGAFSGHLGHFIEIEFGRYSRLEDCLAKTRDINFGSTDCTTPIRRAIERNIPVDVFCVLTDSETYAGTPHPSQALKDYRNKTGIPAKMIVVGMTATEFTIADSNDAGMMDVVGFSTDTPAVMADFAR